MQLLRAVREARQAAARRAVLEVQFSLAERKTGADRVDGDPDLHPVAVGEGQRGAQGLDPHRALAGDGGGGLGAAETADRPAREAEGETEAAAGAIGESGDREIALPCGDRLHQRRQPAGRGAEIAVAEKDEPRRRICAERRLGRGGHVGALAVGAAAADDLGAGLHRQLGGAVGRGVVGDPERRPGEGRAQGGEGRGDAIGLVASGDDHGERAVCFDLESHETIIVRAMADIEAHITGNVWKIEVAVGDEVSDGDTVVILESMKMEIPVEAEDDGTVKEIRCEEGQSVSEGDVLVVLE